MLIREIGSLEHNGPPSDIQEDPFFLKKKKKKVQKFERLLHNLTFRAANSWS